MRLVSGWKGPGAIAAYRAGVRVTFQAAVAASVETLRGRVRVAEVAVTATL